jgi:glucosamine--fructose-6-phosphate aminotransferase (isomerizing)
MTSAMAAEIAEIPAVARRLLSETDALQRVLRAFAGRRFPFAVVCGRGSSGHAGVYLRYLIETRLGLVVSAAAPSVITTYRRLAAMDGALFVVISQSGRSPDLVEATRAAVNAGAVTMALVNDTQSPVAQAATFVLPLAAGAERSVAATKTVAGSMIVSAQLIAALAEDAELQAAIGRWPDRLAAALALDWSAWGTKLRPAHPAFVAARGYGLGPAREIALKLGEVMRLPALAYSAAELRHGPRAAIAADTPVLILRQADATARTVDELATDLAGAPVFVCGGPAGNLPWLADDHPATDPLTMLLPAYRAIEAAAQRAGFDPDRPPFLSKVTETL